MFYIDMSVFCILDRSLFYILYSTNIFYKYTNIEYRSVIYFLDRSFFCISYRQDFISHLDIHTSLFYICTSYVSMSTFCFLHWQVVVLHPHIAMSIFYIRPSYVDMSMFYFRDRSTSYIARLHIPTSIYSIFTLHLRSTLTWPFVTSTYSHVYIPHPYLLF